MAKEAAKEAAIGPMAGIAAAEAAAMDVTIVVGVAAMDVTGANARAAMENGMATATTAPASNLSSLLLHSHMS